MALGRASALDVQQPVLIVGAGGPAAAQPATVVSRRVFAGYWEYLLEDAIFTAPPYPAWNGAALVGRDGKLLGIGSLIVPDAAPRVPGNMFVPVERLKASLADLLFARPAGDASASLARHQRPGDRRPPRRHPGLRPAAGPAGRRRAWQRPSPRWPDARSTISSAFYRELWAQGSAGVEVRLTVRDDGQERDIRSRPSTATSI